jgi:hypothetical protein
MFVACATMVDNILVTAAGVQKNSPVGPTNISFDHLAGLRNARKMHLSLASPTHLDDDLGLFPRACELKWKSRLRRRA